MSQLVEESSIQESYKVPERKPSFLETKILPALKYIGFIGAGVLIVAYIVIVMVLIQGFKVEMLTNTIVFACVNGAIGFFVMQFLKIQGESFAKHLDCNKPIIEAYYKTKTKDKKTRSIKYFWLVSTAKDLVFKVGSVIISSIGIVYIVIEGSHDYNLLLLAIVNILLFLCFGILGLNKAYEFFNNRHIPYMVEKLNEAERRKYMTWKELAQAIANLEVNTDVQV